MKGASKRMWEGASETRRILRDQYNQIVHFCNALMIPRTHSISSP